MRARRPRSPAGNSPLACIADARVEPLRADVIVTFLVLVRSAPIELPGVPLNVAFLCAAKIGRLD